ncbi:MAG: hypothetical protein ACRDRX_06675 [Pseudonocardiaceae bacterium]
MFAIAQAEIAHTAAEKATAARRKAAAALAAKAQADDAVEEVLVELDRVRAQNTAQLAEYQNATERAYTGACTELEEVRSAAAKAVTDAQEAAKAAIQKAIADRDRILAERTADMRQQIDRANEDAQAQIKILQNQLDAAKAETETEQRIKIIHGELAHATAASGAETENANAERAAELNQELTVAQQHRAHRLAETPAPRDLSGRRKSKMTPQLVDKAQRMYKSRRFTVAEIAQACSVSPTTIYRHIRTAPQR